MKRKCWNVEQDKCKQMIFNRQNEGLEQWEMNRAVNYEVLGSILGRNKQKFLFHL